MKSIKPGRGPSFMGGVGGLVAVVFGIFWTIMAFSMVSATGGALSVFPIFGIFFIIFGIINTVYNFKNATGKNRFSTFDIVDSSEEQDPLDRYVRRDEIVANANDDDRDTASDVNFCPYCGTKIKEGFEFCAKCGKKLP